MKQNGSGSQPGRGARRGCSTCRGGGGRRRWRASLAPRGLGGARRGGARRGGARGRLVGVLGLRRGQLAARLLGSLRRGRPPT